MTILVLSGVAAAAGAGALLIATGADFGGRGAQAIDASTQAGKPEIINAYLRLGETQELHLVMRPAIGDLYLPGVEGGLETQRAMTFVLGDQPFQVHEDADGSLAGGWLNASDLIDVTFVLPEDVAFQPSQEGRLVLGTRPTFDVVLVAPGSFDRSIVPLQIR